LDSCCTDGGGTSAVPKLAGFAGRMQTCWPRLYRGWAGSFYSVAIRFAYDKSAWDENFVRADELR
jgi:hypothetical protein